MSNPKSDRVFMYMLLGFNMAMKVKNCAYKVV